MTLPAFAATSGPKNAKIALVGEAWGEQEALISRPFVGYSGQELTRMLAEAGIERKDCFLTNVFALRPMANNLEHLCGKRADVGEDYPYPPIKPGFYVLPKYLPELDRLWKELEVVKPNLILALGNIACWALLRRTGISALRGTVNESPWGKVLPTYHPAGIMRQWNWRVIAVADFIKAKREMEFPEIRRPERYVVYNSSLEEISEWYETHGKNAQILGVDTETYRRQIRCIGFASSRVHAIVINFVDFNKPGNNFWPDLAGELEARKWTQRFLSLPCPKVFQNGLYDFQYLLRENFSIENAIEDTMLRHHALYPELQKGLGFLGSIYSNEAAWKLMRKEKEELKRDE